MMRKAGRIGLLAALLLVAACQPGTDPGDPAAFSTDTLRYSIDAAFEGRILTAKWYHVSFSSPLAVRTLASRPMGQALPLASDRGEIVLPANLDSDFEFYAKFSQYAADEAVDKIKTSLKDSLAIYEARHWAMAPLYVARTDEFARITFAQAGAGTKPSDTVAMGSGMVLLWVRDSLDAEREGALAKRKLTGKFGRGWHLLRYQDSGRILLPASLKDTVRFRADAPNPNLV